ncbi:MAG: ABC transporter substrate-binding protein [Reyranella sp.]|uniref:ABC transporter substrate-binding protein n=1 Tax=Reyranella sp. TaxID=1929291 RepID=UPI0012117535|nr:ABC transporter substrate-binding protein [Reyranella sp.]TAJ97749.1 MAG: ABC transporter substrate-binding protein [Reyranella sp.]TBR28595.1 MAG: ABC transporter substrate-binding protein [Reyranella sp.]
MRRWFVASVVSVATVLSPVVASAESVLRVVMQSDVKIIDPVWSSGYITRNYAYMIYDTLFAVDGQFQIKPQMVDTYKTSDDGLTWTFTLRDGLEWHDGAPVTAEDCVASLKRWSVRDPMGQKLASYLSEYRIVDARTFQIVLKEKFGPMLEALGKPSVIVPFMMPKRVAETDPFKQMDSSIGSGPFLLKRDEWKPGEKMVFVKNPKYRPRAEPVSGLAGGKVAGVDRVEWIAMPDAETQINALMNGEVDLLEVVSADHLPILEKAKGVKVVKSPVPYQYTFRPNWLQPPFNNVKIRRAAAYALSQPDFLEASIGDKRFYRTCKALFTCESPLASDAGTQGLVEGNIAKAKELLKEAGYDGTPVVMPQPTDFAVLKQIAPVAKSQLEKAGFKVDVQAMDWQSLIGRINTKRGPPSEGGWNAYGTAYSQVDILDPLMTLNLVATCEKAQSGWPCDPELEKLRDAYAKATTPAEKKAAAEAVQVRAMEVVTHVPLGEWFGLRAVRDNINVPTPLPPVTVFWGITKK